MHPFLYPPNRGIWNIAAQFSPKFKCVRMFSCVRRVEYSATQLLFGNLLLARQEVNRLFHVGFASLRFLIAGLYAERLIEAFQCFVVAFTGTKHQTKIQVRFLDASFAASCGFAIVCLSAVKITLRGQELSKANLRMCMLRFEFNRLSVPFFC